MDLTYTELHEQLMYNPWTGHFYWKVSNSNRVHTGDVAGSKDADGYIIIGINNKLYKAHRLCWFYIHGYLPENDIDHKDRIKHHNWINNLREINVQCNQRNTGNPRNNTSGIKGIYWNKNKMKWQSQIYIDNKLKYLGAYKEFEEAVCARLAGEQCLNWAGCDSESPAFKYVRDNTL